MTIICKQAFATENISMFTGELRTIAETDPNYAEYEALLAENLYIEEYAGKGWSGLPIVSEADNGDVLAVVEGEWAKSEAPTTEPFTFTITGEITTEGHTLDTDVSYADLKDCFDNNRTVKATVMGSETPIYLSFMPEDDVAPFDTIIASSNLFLTGEMAIFVQLSIGATFKEFYVKAWEVTNIPSAQ